MSRVDLSVIDATGGATAAVTGRDAARLLRFVSDTEELGGDEPFSPPVLQQLGNLIPADWIGYEERDFVGARCLVQYAHPELPNEFDPEAARCFREEDPFWPYHSSGNFGAIRLSDLLPQRVFLRTRYYALVNAPLGITDTLAGAIPSPPWHSKRFLLDRHGGHFSKRDRTVLDHLRPHFDRHWHAAQIRRRLRAAIAGLESASEQDARGVIFLAADRRIEFASPPARRLMRDCFGAREKAELPVALREWLDSGTPTFRLRLKDRSMTVFRSGDALLLEEARDELGLTAREREILTWLARGGTNSEIAEALWIAPTTVRKHLENVYAKLGVRTRTAAATRYLSVRDDKAPTRGSCLSGERRRA